jgi:hypothetical protein
MVKNFTVRGMRLSITYGKSVSPLSNIIALEVDSTHNATLHKISLTLEYPLRSTNLGA